MKYYLKTFFQDKDVEVTREQYLQAERLLGIVPINENQNEPISEAFKGQGLSGWIQYNEENETKEIPHD